MQLATMRKRLTGLRPQAYEHPQDAVALNLLKKTPGLDTVTRKVNEWGLDRQLHIQATDSYLRATPDRFSELHELLDTACTNLDERIPRLYIAGLAGITPLFEHQIENIRCAAVFIGASGVGLWQEQEMYGFLREFVRRKAPVIPVVLADAPSVPALPLFLRAMTWVDFRANDPDPFDRLLWGVTDPSSRA